MKPTRRPVIPPPIAVPAPPSDVTALDPLLESWPAGKTLRRCFDAAWGSRQFYAGDQAHRGRFHPLRPVGRATDLPVLYAADSQIGALSETVCHDVPVRGVKVVPYAKLWHRLIVDLEPVRELRLVDLRTLGLRRLGVSRVELIESDPRSYADTAAWARALHDHPIAVDGLLWVSRQHDSSEAVVLFGDRVDSGELRLVPGHVPLVLGEGSGLDLVSRVADDAGITIANLP